MGCCGSKATTDSEIVLVDGSSGQLSSPAAAPSPAATPSPAAAPSPAVAASTATDSSPAVAASTAAAPFPAAAPPRAFTRYTEPDEIWAALMTGSVRLAKASYLMQLAGKGGILPRRQDLPSEAYISVEELKRLYGDGNRDGVLPIISISFCEQSQHVAPIPIPSEPVAYA